MRFLKIAGSLILVGLIGAALAWFARGVWDKKFLMEGHFHVTNHSDKNVDVGLQFPSGAKFDCELQGSGSTDFRFHNTGEGSVTALVNGKVVAGLVNLRRDTSGWKQGIQGVRDARYNAAMCKFGEKSTHASMSVFKCDSMLKFTGKPVGTLYYCDVCSVVGYWQSISVSRHQLDCNEHSHSVRYQKRAAKLWASLGKQVRNKIKCKRISEDEKTNFRAFATTAKMHHELCLGRIAQIM